MKKPILRNHPPRVALIGVTGFGETHFNALRQLESEGLLKLSAATVINREQAADACAALEASGCTIYSDYREMLTAERGRIDLCSIPTGIAWHCPMTIAALEADCHVLVEKPVAGTVAEVDQMIAARDAAGRLVFVGFQDLYHPSIIAMKKRVIAGDIGRVESVRVWANWPRRPSYYARNNWAGCLKSGEHWVYDSPANNALAHYLIAALYFSANELQAVAHAVRGQAELYRAKPIESFDTICSRLQMDSGVEVQFTVSHSGQEPHSPVVQITGTQGVVQWDFNNRISIEPVGESLAIQAGHPSTMLMFRAILEALHSDNPQGCSLEMAREHTLVINGLHAHCPIHDVVEPYRQVVESNGELFPSIVGVEHALQDSFKSGKLFTELGLPWSSPATEFTF